MNTEITPRKLKRYLLAEETCRAFRWCIGRRVCDVTEQDWNDAITHLTKWMRLAGKSCYNPPKKLRKKKNEPQ